ncbi:MAG: hypothetical protein QOI66_2473, partial [Myxococcales bacterium]|nr:hypothetical protein [Myxococcales bacterium]
TDDTMGAAFNDVEPEGELRQQAQAARAVLVEAVGAVDDQVMG